MRVLRGLTGLNKEQAEGTQPDNDWRIIPSSLFSSDGIYQNNNSGIFFLQLH